MADRFDLERFVVAQDRVFERVLAELRAGAKHTHWMWFVFPQIAGLGSSPTAQAYAIASAEEAAAYLAHPLLGPRLDLCTRLVIGHADKPVEQIFGPLDAMKFRSSMTLFAHVAEEPNAFEEALKVCFGGHADGATQAKLLSGV